MTTPLTIKDLNCSTCPSCDKNTGTWDYCNEGDFAIEPLYVKRTIGIVGCASHPLALQVLTAPVLEKIKRTNDECCGSYGLWEMNSEQCEQFVSSDETPNCTLCKVTKAITLLKGDH